MLIFVKISGNFYDHILEMHAAIKEKEYLFVYFFSIYDFLIQQHQPLESFLNNECYSAWSSRRKIVSAIV